MKAIQLIISAALLFGAVNTHAQLPKDIDAPVASDVHGTEVNVFTPSDVNRVWEGLSRDDNLITCLQEIGFNVIGLSVKYRDPKGYVRHKVKLSGEAMGEELPVNWLSITYVGSPELDGEPAFFKDRDQDIIYFYEPGSSKF